MTPDGPLKLLREVRDLQIVDVEGRNCGICDDIEFEEGPGGTLKLHALLLGPAARRRRYPAWTSRLLDSLLPARLVRVPWADIETITSRIKLKQPAAHYGLLRVEARLARHFQRIPSL